VAENAVGQVDVDDGRVVGGPWIEAGPEQRGLGAARALLVGILLIQVGGGLQGVLVGIRTESEGFGLAVSGIVMASFFLGVMIGTRLAEHSLAAVGHIRVFAALASMASGASILHLLWINPAAWALLRMLFGLCIAGVFVVVESWLNDMATNATRGRLLSAYMVSSMSGLTLGQLLLKGGDPESFELFVISSVLISAALVPITLSATSAPPLSVPEPLSLRQLISLAPAGVVGEDLAAPRKEVDWMRRLSAATGRPVTFALVQVDAAPELWREIMDRSAAAAAEGARLHPQVAPRCNGILIGLQTNHAFSSRPSFAEIAELPLAELVVELHRPERKAAILAEESSFDNQFAEYMGTQLHRIYVLGDPPDYEPGPERSVAAMAAAQGRKTEDLLYDLLLTDDGRALLLFPFLNYSHGNADAVREMFLHPSGVSGLSDGGAHCGAICDASMPTWLLTFWARDRWRGEKLPLAYVVQKQSRDTARLFGLTDRGTLEPGMKADINIIDHERLTLHPPKLVADLPAGGRRFDQRATGYVATLVSGVVTRRNGTDTGARPGKLLRAGAAA